MANPPAATVTSVAASTSSVPLFAPNTTDHGRIIFNDSAAVLYVLFGSGATTTSYTVQIAAGGYFEFPLGSNGLYTGQEPCIYTGEVDGVWASAAGSARLTSW